VAESGEPVAEGKAAAIRGRGKGEGKAAAVVATAVLSSQNLKAGEVLITAGVGHAVGPVQRNPEPLADEISV
jgi:hypothetical protein